MVQRRTVRWVSRNYSPYVSVTQMQNNLGWRTLEGRKADARLILFYKIVYEPPRDKINKVSVRPAKTQISLGIRPVLSESSLSTWRKLGSLATHWAHNEYSDQTGRMPRLIWVFAGRTATLLVLSRGGSIMVWLLYPSPSIFNNITDWPGRQMHSLHFIQIPATAGYYKYSFFPLVIVQWSQLIHHIPGLPDLDSFRSGVRTLSHCMP